MCEMKAVLPLFLPLVDPVVVKLLPSLVQLIALLFSYLVLPFFFVK